MGWLFSERWLKRSDLIKDLVENKGGAKVLKHCCVGNNLWLVFEHTDGQRSVGLCMMKGPHNCGKGYIGRDRDWWGYKDVHESMGPCVTSCPESYLTMCTAPENKWSYDWRQKIYAKHQERRARPKIVVGTRLKYGGVEYEVTKCLGNRGYRVNDMYRMRKSQADQSIILGV